ncbi:hypothetical protein [Saccharopolyspora gregorii]|uniref:hypothetical protein n=1 Tax=Saccharopolyspora gregorii TaxID=33914 RepID=UPI0021AC3351|nr:hypothetical protein [Saccharopolyspora gregorii]
MTQGFDVDLQVLDSAGEAVAQTMHDMQSCKVEDICGDEQQYGHAGLHDAFEHFCDRWQHGVEVLIEDGDTITQVLNKVVDTYVEADAASEESMRAVGRGEDPAAGVADG